jgi:riboflavin synthase
MFTGLIEELGTLAAVDHRHGGRVLRVSAKTVVEGIALGDSVSLNGVCQTVTAFGPGWFEVEAVGDTLLKTTLGGLNRGAVLNLERACRADTRLGGHFVLGHVNGVGTVSSWTPEGDAWFLEVVPPPELLKYLVDEGSVAIDGISLTVAEAKADRFRVSVIPHTRAHTTLAAVKPGDRVNLEADILAKYVEGLLKRHPLKQEEGGLSAETLAAWGYR